MKLQHLFYIKLESAFWRNDQTQKVTLETLYLLMNIQILHKRTNCKTQCV